ncbi:MAG: NUDIX domain-containing protein [Candidatus Pacearchaeota archaeon]
MLKELFSQLSLKKQDNYRRGVFLVVYKKEKGKVSYLLLKRKLHWTGWEFPKGGIEPGETAMQTIYRELKEETNLKPIKITAHDYEGKYNYDKKTKQDKKRKGYFGQSFKLYSVKIKSRNVKLDKKEHETYKWASFNEALDLLTWVDQKNSLNIVNKSL